MSLSCVCVCGGGGLSARAQGARPGLEYYSAGRDVEIGLAFPRAHQQGVFEGQLAHGVEAPMSLSRGTWLGAARYGGAVWPGDIQSNFTSFAQQIAIAQVGFRNV